MKLNDEDFGLKINMVDGNTAFFLPKKDEYSKESLEHILDGLMTLAVVFGKIVNYEESQLMFMLRFFIV